MMGYGLPLGRPRPLRAAIRRHRTWPLAAGHEPAAITGALALPLAPGITATGGSISLATRLAAGAVNGRPFGAGYSGAFGSARWSRRWNGVSNRSGARPAARGGADRDIPVTQAAKEIGEIAGNHSLGMSAATYS